ncbi:lipopolysaccharide biosynthesis protein [Mycobacterium sp. NPDC003449]
MSTTDATRYDATLHPVERRAVVLGAAFRVAGTPLIALVGLVNTALIVRQTGETVFGVVSLITTLTLLIPFADLGIGAVVTSACSRPGRLCEDHEAVATVQRGLRMLILVAAGLMLTSMVVMAADGWHSVIGARTGPDDRLAVTVATCLIAVGIPAGIGIRIIIGLNMNPLAVLLSMTNAVFALMITVTLKTVGAAGIWYAVSGPFGALAGNCMATVLALRLSGLRWSAFSSPRAEYRNARLLRGSLWMFVLSIGLPLGLQSHRLILSHVSTPDELSRYALTAQIFAVVWMVFDTAGMALWPVFVKRRPDPDASMRLWLKSVTVFGTLSVAAGIGIVALAPWATSLLSGGQVVATRALALAFAVLLIVECVHLPGGVMLTMPMEARWQSSCITVMGVTTVLLGTWWAGRWGGAGVIAAAVVAMIIAQVIPDFVWSPRLLRRRAL